MKDGFPIAPLSEVLEPITRATAPISGKMYRQLGVQLWGRGAYERESLDGCNTKYVSLSEVKTGDVVVNKIWARNGSVAVVQEELDGCYVSGEFPTYLPNRDRVDPRWIHWLTKTSAFWKQCDEKSQGTSGKNRIKPEQFLKVEIPLPPLDEQQRILSRIELFASKLHAIRSLQDERKKEVEFLLDRFLYDSFPQPSEDTLVGNYLHFQTGYAFKSEWFSEDGLRLARNVNVSHGKLDWTDTVRIPFDLCEEFSSFELKEGDILVSLDRPIISTGVKVARVGPYDLPCLLLQRVARPIFDEGLLPDYFYHWLTSSHFTSAIDPGRSNGVPHISHKDIEAIPFSLPSLQVQREIVSHVENIKRRYDEICNLRVAIDRAQEALMPSILDKAFKGEL